MTMVVTEPCRGCKDKSCLLPCPAECFYEDASMVYINPDDCTDCGACETECPVQALFYDHMVPDEWTRFIELNRTRSNACPPATEKST